MSAGSRPIGAGGASGAAALVGRPGHWADIANLTVAVPAALAGGYLALLAARSSRIDVPQPSETIRFSVVVPAHDEAAGIAATVASLRALRYHADRFRVIVVADNCTDDTASIARTAGATVIERVDPSRRGKGFALEYAFESIVRDEWTDAVVVVDADSTVSSNLLGSFAAHIDAGAVALQADYRVSNAERSWRTGLMKIAFAAFHEVRSLARERMGVSCGLRGNGMCFTRATLVAVPHRAHSLVEDLEYGLRLGRAGIRVTYVPEAAVESDMPADAESARSQRRRWEEGRSRFRREQGPRLAWDGIVGRNKLLADLAADVIVPPLGQLSAAAVATTAVGALVRGRSSMSARAGAFALLGIGAHVARAWQISGTGVAGLRDLARAPIYVAWKLIQRRPETAGTQEWQRTQRAPSPVPSSADVSVHLEVGQSALADESPDGARSFTSSTSDQASREVS
jgi:1,2-diacylglycerol 3-beta-glucosyltransferase